MADQNGGDGASKPEPQVPDPVVNAVTSAYYSRAFTAPDTVRGRAQLVFSIATVVAAAVLAGGVFSGVGDATPDFRFAAIAVVGLWLIATGTSMWAVARPFRDPKEGESEGSPYRWIQHVATNSLAERNDVLRWQKIGGWTTLLALAGTLVATAWWISAPQYETKKVTLVLDAAGIEAYFRVCGIQVSDLTATVQLRSLDSEQLIFVPPKRLCEGRAKAIRMPRSDIMISAVP